jgi:hypothetical protein
MPSLSEKEVMKVFNHHKRKFIRILGRKATTDTQLNDVGQAYFPQFVGAFSQDVKITPTPARQYFIINTDRKHQPGTHWCGVVKNGKTYYVYDSFGRTSSRLLPHFSKGKLVVDSDYDAEQFGKTEICGVLCLAWIATVAEVGIRNALKV